MEQWCNDTDEGSSSIRWKPCFDATSFTSDLIWSDLGSNPGFAGERPATSRPTVARPVNNSVEQSRSWEGGQEMSFFLWNTNVSYRFYKLPPLVVILSQINLVHVYPSHICRSILMLFSHLRLRLHEVSFPPFFYPNHECNCLLSCACHMPRSSHPPSYDHSNYSWWRAQIIKLLVCSLARE